MQECVRCKRRAYKKHKAKKDAVPFQKSGKKTKSCVPLVGDARNTRFLEFLAGVLSKGVWWMPRLKKAMKDAA